ncbi:MAG: hypothetical protein FJ135_06065 [Deltaproteobacteria bacterium]|nr:hypothetical protein [Deltaproteobacteria bacterium]
MIRRWPVWFFVIIGYLMTLAWVMPAGAQKSATPPATLQKAVELLNKAEKQVADEPDAALQSAKEARLLFRDLKKDLAAKLADYQLTEAQLEEEDFNTRLAEDLFKKGELFHKGAKEKMARSKDLADQGDEVEARKMEAVAQIEARLALQHYVRSQIYHLRNQQMIFQTILRQKK